MTEHMEYPLTMAHPAFTPAKSLPIPGTERKDAAGRVLSMDYQGTPERFPPVTVNSPDEREFYEAQGYKMAGHSDPAAYAQAHASPAPPDYVPERYPMWIGDTLVHNEEEERALVGNDTDAVDPSAEKSGDDSGVNKLRAEYQARFGKKPYMGWDEHKLLEKLAA